MLLEASPQLWAGGGAVLAVMYGRKASAQVSARSPVKAGEYILAARPSISAAGVFRLKFAVADGITVRTTEIIRTDTGLEDGQFLGIVRGFSRRNLSKAVRR